MTDKEVKENNALDEAIDARVHEYLVNNLGIGVLCDEWDSTLRISITLKGEVISEDRVSIGSIHRIIERDY